MGRLLEREAHMAKMATNLAIRAAVECMTEIMGKNGAKMIFKKAGIERLFDNPPDYTWDPCISVDQQTQIYIEAANLLGLKGALALWRRIGYAAVKAGAEMGHGFDSFKDLPQDEKYMKCVEILSLAIGRGRIVTNERGGIDFEGFDCIVCSPYHNTGVTRPVCTMYVGAFQYIADFAYGKGARTIYETKCKAMGDDSCYYTL
jgi:predicted hydrocarbon binding protein